jgi:hypothetical protein
MKAARALLISASLLCVIASTGCMPLFPSPGPASPLLTRPLIRDLMHCQSTINRYGQRLVRTQVKSVEDCAEDILDVAFLFDNDIIDEDEFLDEIDRIRDKCDRGLEKVTKISTKFYENVVDACEPVEDLILNDDQLRFQLLADETDGILNVGSVNLLAGSLCGIKSLIAMQLVLFEVPRVMELFRYLGESYIEITDENDFEIGHLVIPLFEECTVPTT